MQAEELLRDGDLNGALAALQESVRKDPADPKLRIFLFQLFCVLGDWNRALTQLRLCGQMEPLALPMVQTYREAIACEMFREKVFRGETAPLVFGEPAHWIALMIEALGTLARGKPKAAAALRAEAFDMAPATPGAVNGERFAWLADADMRLGPVLEIVMNGRYFWAPFALMHDVRFEAPTDLRDRVWTPAEITWANGGQVPVLIPTRYPGAAEAERDELKLARATDWADRGAETFVGSGQRVLATDAGEFGLMDIRHLLLEPEPPSAEAADTDADAPAAGDTAPAEGGDGG